MVQGFKGPGVRVKKMQTQRDREYGLKNPEQTGILRNKRDYEGGRMAIIDDLKKKTEEGLKTLKETAQDIAFNVEKQAMIGKKKYIDITKAQRNIQKLYDEIGEYVYDIFTSDRTVSREDSYITERVHSISRLKLVIRDIEEEVDKIRQTQPPKDNL